MGRMGREPLPDPRKEIMREAFSWFKTILFALAFAWAFTNFVIVNAQIPTGSMENTIRVGDRIVALRLSYLFSEPDRFDIIVFRGTGEDTTLYVKRVIGVPGDTVSIIGGRVHINGNPEPIRDDFVLGDFFGNFGPFPSEGVIPEGHYFVLGDNRNNSIDSRHWESPFVTEEQIRGKVLFRYFPGIANLSN